VGQGVTVQFLARGKIFDSQHCSSPIRSNVSQVKGSGYERLVAHAWYRAGGVPTCFHGREKTGISLKVLMNLFLSGVTDIWPG
jgi:hypothetical protein